MKLWKPKPAPVDATAQPAAGAGPSTIGAMNARHLPPGTRAGAVVVGVVLLGAGYYAYSSVANDKRDEAAAREARFRSVIPTDVPVPKFETVRPERKEGPTQLASIAPLGLIENDRDWNPPPQAESGPFTPAPAKKEKTPLEEMLASPLAKGNPPNDDRQAGQAGAGAPSGRVPGGAAGLNAAKLTEAHARVIGSPEYVVKEGTEVPCITTTRIVSTKPGMVKCVLEAPVWTMTGAMIALDRGTELVGWYEADMTQGQERLGIVWTLATTPKYVEVDLNSPGTGPLGEAGVGGHVDRHFWERFGGAFMVTLIGGIGDAIGNSTSASGTPVVIGGAGESASSAAARVLENTINIRPTLTLNHGERIMVMTARKLNFKSVYELGLR